MRKRKQRLSLCKSNTDYRNNKYFHKTAAYIYHRRLKGENYLNYLSKHRKHDQVKKFTQTRLQRRQVPDPLNKTQTFYQKEKKMQKQRIRIGSKNLMNQTFCFPTRVNRSNYPSQFLGDSQVCFEVKEGLHKKIMRKQRSFELVKHKSKRPKYDEHATAVVETQLIPMDKYQAETKSGMIDLEKIREIQRLIRRRYCGRKNIQRLFKEWDMDNNGKISIKNVQKMISKFGLHINEDESRVIVSASASEGKNYLKIGGFIDMLYNVDIIQPYLKKAQSKVYSTLIIIHQNSTTVRY